MRIMLEVDICVSFAACNGLCNDFPLNGVNFRKELEKMTSKRIVVLYSLERGAEKRIAEKGMISSTKLLKKSTSSVERIKTT